MTTSTDDPTPVERLESLRASLGARAAGWWVLRGPALEQVAFVAAPDMHAEVAEGFPAATRSVSLAAHSLGIVKAVTRGSTVVSRAVELPPEEGSGYWLRRFDADRSVAVPVFGTGGRVVGVASVALGEGLSDEEVARLVGQTAARWPLPADH